MKPVLIALNCAAGTNDVLFANQMYYLIILE